MSRRDPLRVLVVDASAADRGLLCEAIAADAELELAAEAGDAWEARDALVEQRPDVIVLDLDLPRLDGLDFLQRYMRALPTPTVVLDNGRSGDRARIAAALAAGAVCAVTRPHASDLLRARRQLRLIAARIKAAARGAVRPQARAAGGAGVGTGFVAPELSESHIIAVGSSTGGVEALSQLLPGFDQSAPAMLIVQHMPAGFTASLARRLDALGGLRVREACDGDRVVPGQALLAPGGVQHMVLARVGAQWRVRLVPGDPVNYSRPSVDVLFESVAEQAGARGAAILLTGMGSDGAAGMLSIRRRGGHTVAQDEATSAVFGMPQMAGRLGAAEAVAPLPEIAATLARLMTGKSTAAAKRPFRAGEPDEHGKRI